MTSAKPMPMGKATARTGDADGGHQQHIANVEDHPARKGQQQAARAGACEIVPETFRTRGVGAAKRQAYGQAEKQDAPDVIPVEKLESPASGGLLRIAPTPPAGHAQDHQGQCGGINLRDEHVALLTKADR